MNNTVIIDGQKYTFVQKIADITTHKTVALCKDERGCFCICNLEEYERSKEDKHKNTFNKYVAPEKSNRQIKHRIEFRPVNVRKYKQKRSVRL